MTLWLFAGLPPSPFKEGIASCIPKVKEPSAPNEFRPITVSPVMSRLFHQIINRRMLQLWPLSPRQKAFRPGDGLGDNMWFVKALIDKKDRKGKS